MTTTIFARNRDLNHCPLPESKLVCFKHRLRTFGHRTLPLGDGLIRRQKKNFPKLIKKNLLLRLAKLLGQAFW